MKENLNLVEILKDCSEGTKLYSPLYGDVELGAVSRSEDTTYPIKIKLSNDLTLDLTKDGKIYATYPGECMLFPSHEQRDWSKFKPIRLKFDPKTLQPFDKVVIWSDGIWCCDFFSSPCGGTYLCVGCLAVKVMPYNDETKRLIGTSDEAPEYYRYWED